MGRDTGTHIGEESKLINFLASMSLKNVYILIASNYTFKHLF